MNRKKARRSSGMCYQHEHFIAKCSEAMEIMPEHKNHPMTNHKHRLRNDYKCKK
jgi:predicted metal-dependent phosphotriesterase family hydrolase